MTQRFLDKTVLITGGGSGIGRETAIQFASEGAYVIIFDMDTQGAEEVVGTIIDKGGKADFLKVDVSNSSIVNDYVSELSKKFEIDILVNNAGIAHIGTIEQTTEQDLDRIYNVNVKGCYNLMHAVIPQMKQRKQGVILNIASIASSVGIKDRFAYSMSKGAVLTMTYSVAKDYISDGIRCNCIAPARVHTPFVDNFLEKTYPDNKEEMFEMLSNSQPIGRMGAVNEISSLICFLCSDDAAFITGSNIPIDGGFVTLNN